MTSFAMTEYGLSVRQRRREEARIRRVLRRNAGNAAQTSRELGIPLERVRRIKNRAGIQSERSLWRRVTGNREAEKSAVRSRLEAGMSAKAVARETGVPTSTVRAWRDAWGIEPQPSGHRAITNQSR